jgi:hypothetical protein
LSLKRKCVWAHNHSLYNNDRDNNQQLSYRWKRKKMLRSKEEKSLKES